MTDCRDAGGTPMDSTVGRGEAIGVPPASLRQVHETVIAIRFKVVLTVHYCAKFCAKVDDCATRAKCRGTRMNLCH